MGITCCSLVHVLQTDVCFSVDFRLRHVDSRSVSFVVVSLYERRFSIFKIMRFFVN